MPENFLIHFKLALSYLELQFVQFHIKGTALEKPHPNNSNQTLPWICVYTCTLHNHLSCAEFQ
jgi:hypothetical protein